MKLKLPLIGAALLAVSLQVGAQSSCGTMEHLEHLLRQDAQLAKSMAQIERFTESRLQNSAFKAEVNVTIPVVVHIVYKSSSENLSDAVITDQIAVLNEDFRKLNANQSSIPNVFKSLHADTKVNFCLASIDPQGNPTTGITRTSTSVPLFNQQSNNIKYTSQGGRDAWPRDQYLNIWVGAISSPVGGVVGYAQFPGGAAATDGVVVDPRWFGRNSSSNGRTCTHEVGHWLNLRHIWGDQTCGDDYVSDTPTQLTSNSGCPSHPKPSCLNTGDMFMNYMDYTDGSCQSMFSLGQKDRMQAVLVPGGFRASLAYSNGCGNGSVPVCQTPGGLGASGITPSAANLSWTAVSGASSYNVRYRLQGTGTWSQLSAGTNSLSLSGLSSASTYEAQVQTQCGAGNQSAYSGSISFTTATSGGGGGSQGDSLSLGSGSTAFSNAPYGTYYMDERAQFIITKSELLAAGYTGGPLSLSSLAFQVSTASSQLMNNFTISLSHTSATEFTTSGGLFGTTPFLSGSNTTQVYSSNFAATANTWNKHNFTQNFAYNGNDNILIDICWDNNSYTTNSTVLASNVGSNRTIYSQTDVSNGNNCSAASGTRSTTRPNMRLGLAPASGSLLALSVLEFGGEGALDVFPNPFKRDFTVRISQLQSDAQIQITNSLGQIVHIEQIKGRGSIEHKISLPETFGGGVYILSIQYNGRTENRPLVWQP